MNLKTPDQRSVITSVTRFGDGTVGLNLGVVMPHYISIADELKAKRVDPSAVVSIFGSSTVATGVSWRSVREIHSDRDVILRSEMPSLVRVTGQLFLFEGCEVNQLRNVTGDLQSQIAMPELMSVTGSVRLHEGAVAPELRFVGGWLATEGSVDVHPHCTVMMGMQQVHEALMLFERNSRSTTVNLASAIERLSDTDSLESVAAGVNL